MKDKTVTIGLLQQSRNKNVEQNLEATILEIKESAKMGAQIICLQELFRSRYFCQSENSNKFNLSETIPGPTTAVLSRLAKELEIVIISPLFEKRAEGIYHNTAVVIDADGSIVDTYRKMHIPDDPYFYEKFYFTPGDKGFRSFSHSLWMFGDSHLLGPMVPRGSAPSRSFRCSVYFLSYRNWLPRQGLYRS